MSILGKFAGRKLQAKYNQELLDAGFTQPDLKVAHIDLIFQLSQKYQKALVPPTRLAKSGFTKDLAETLLAQELILALRSVEKLMIAESALKALSIQARRLDNGSKTIACTYALKICKRASSLYEEQISSGENEENFYSVLEKSLADASSSFKNCLR